MKNDDNVVGILVDNLKYILYLNRDFRDVLASSKFDSLCKIDFFKINLRSDLNILNASSN